jgi:hypothetical protein
MRERATRHHPDLRELFHELRDLERWYERGGFTSLLFGPDDRAPPSPLLRDAPAADAAGAEPPGARA